MKKYLYGVAACLVMASAASCSDFLERSPEDALSPASFWQSESDAYLAMTGCYNGLNYIYHSADWVGYNAIYMDCLSDDYFAYFSWEGRRVLTTGNLTANDTGTSFFQFSDIRACNEYLENEGNVSWDSQATEAQYKAEVKTIRALLYLYRSEYYGDFPLITNTIDDPGDSYVSRTPVAEVRSFIVKELEEAIPALPDRKDVTQGRICKQFAQGLLMRYYLWRSDWANSAKYAREIVEKGGLTLSPNYADMFLEGNQYDNETIFDFSFIANTSRDVYGNPFVANGGLGGWSSVVPTVDLMDEFECIDGKPINESPLYDASRPFLNRDPRLRASIVYPGQPYPGYGDGTTKGGYRSVYNSMPKAIDGANNQDYWNNAANASKSGLQLGKYFQASNVAGSDLSHLTLHFKAMRLAEAILTLAECDIEQGNLQEAASLINQVRQRAGMPDVTVSDQATMRAQVRRERRVELNGEGLRRFDLVRWKSENGQPYIVEKFNNFSIEHIDGDLIDEVDANGDYIAVVTGRSADAYSSDNYKSYKPYQVLFPIGQGTLDVNPNLVQNPGY